MSGNLNEALQERISTFHQLPSEPFWQAWQRFNGYQRECPHHDYIDDELLAFFYNGVTRYYQYELDAAGFWDFCAEEDFRGAYRLIDDMAFRSQEYTPLPQYQNPTPQPSKSVTTLEDLQAAFLEAEKTMKKMQEEFVAMKGYSESKHTPVRMVENQIDEVVEVTESQPETLPMCIAAEEETERMDSELTILGAEFAEEINLQPEHAETLEEEVDAAESKEVMLEFIKEPSTVDAIQTPPAEQEEMTTLDEDTLPIPEVQELGDVPCFELCMETEDISLAETCHDSLSAETADFSLTETEDISLTKNQTEHGCRAEDILESAAMPRTGPDKPEYHTVSQLYRLVHHDIGDNLANRWSMSKKGNGFPWDDGISIELKLSDYPGLDGQHFWVSNLLPLLLDQNKSGFLLKNGGTPDGIPRTGPDIPSFHEFDQSQFLRFAGEGGCISYCDVIGSVTRPPEALLNVLVPC